MSSLAYLDIEAAMMICELFQLWCKYLILTPDCDVGPGKQFQNQLFVCRPIGMHVYLRACVYVCVFACACVYVCVYACMRACVHVCVCACACVYVCV